MDKLMQLGYDMSRLWAKYWPDYMTGIRNTLIVAVIATLVGCIIGLICGILNTIPYTKSDAVGKRFILKLIRVIVRIYVEVFRGTPMILQAVFIYYGLPYFSGGAISFKGSTGVWMASLIVVSINTGAYMAESVRGGIISVDPGQTEGAKAIGMTHFQTMVHVILPQAFRNIIPQIGGEAFEGYTSEEMKMQNEGRKILHLPDMNVACTCVRAPVVRSHSISAAVHFAHHISVDEARAAIAAAPGCRLVDDLDALQYPMPLDTSDQDLVFVGRIRPDLTDPNGLCLWCCGDQVRKGAATNCVQIAELLIQNA